MNSTANGRLTYLRVYSGTIRKGETVLDAAAGRTERIGRILRVQADRHADVDRAVAGDIVAVVGLKSARAGATLCAARRTAGPGAADGRPIRSSRSRSRPVEAPTPNGWCRRWRGWSRRTPRWSSGPTPRPGRRVLSGMGELHLEVAVEKLRRAHGLEVNVGRPRVAYRETVERGVSGLMYRHVKQDGGAGQFAHVVLDVEPLVADPRSDGGEAGDEEAFAFGSTVVGGRVPQEYVRAVEAGCRDALAEGPLGGHPVTGCGSR